MRILLVEDDEDITSYIIKGFKQLGYAADSVAHAEEALSALQVTEYDVAIIDLMLPEMSGEELIRRIRSEKQEVPIIILSAKREVEERVKGLQLGADDYLTKPFSFTELVARIDALMRRSKTADVEMKLTVADLVLDKKTRQVWRGGEKIDLRPREYALLEYLIENKGQVMPKAIILEHIWDFYFDPQTNVLDVLIHRLRKKIDEPFDKDLIHTVRGVGYVVRDEEEQAVDTE